MHEQVRALEVREELMPETCPVRRSLDQPGNVRHGELPRVRAVDGAEDRLDRGERVVGDFRLRVRDAAKERGLAGVREAGKRRVDDELEPERELGLAPGQPRLGEARSLAGRGREVRVAAAARSAAASDEDRPGRRQVGDERSLLVEDLRPDGDDDLDRLAVGAVAPVPAPGAARCPRAGSSCAGARRGRGVQRPHG